jgi:hypothetical protein
MGNDHHNFPIIRRCPRHLCKASKTNLQLCHRKRHRVFLSGGAVHISDLGLVYSRLVLFFFFFYLLKIIVLFFFIIDISTLIFIFLFLIFILSLFIQVLFIFNFIL